jgi:glycosyltransferase involved in cell wall biosynthesis
MKQIAVIIPLYNYAAYVGDAIRSVLAQTRSLDEIVIVDDGATDDSVQIVRGFGRAADRIVYAAQTRACTSR